MIFSRVHLLFVWTITKIDLYLLYFLVQDGKPFSAGLQESVLIAVLEDQKASCRFKYTRSLELEF